MVVHTFLNKNNVIIRNSNLNTGRNPVAELFYGGPEGENQYTRMLIYFDETRLKTLYTGGTFPDLTKMRHTLKLTNTSSYDKSLLNKQFLDKDRASSFDLIVFPINQYWDEGVGYDYCVCGQVAGDCENSVGPSNWFNPQTGIDWSGGTGIYSGTASSVIATQHFCLGNENLSVDITDYVNGLITGNTNNGLGIAYNRAYELTSTAALQYVGFFTRHTQTIYEPFVETVYSEHIQDDRNNFYLDKNNKLYLYVNLAGNPTNLDTLPTVTIKDNNSDTYSSYTQSAVTHVTKGVYSIDVIVPTTSDYIDSTMFTDIWQGITINGVTRPDLKLQFALKDSFGYYNIGNDDSQPRKVGISIAGLAHKEKIKRGDIRKVIVSARIPYTVEQTQSITSLKYRVYTNEGRNQLTIIDFQPIEMANNAYYFLLDTNSLLPGTYFVDILVEHNLEVTTLRDITNFEIMSESNLRFT